MENESKNNSVGHQAIAPPTEAHSSEMPSSDTDNLSYLNKYDVNDSVDMSTIYCSADIIGICETFLDPSTSCGQLTINGFDHLKKDRSETVNKTGGGIILYFRNSLNCKCRTEFELSKIETIWAEVSLPNSKPFLVCSVYRPPNATSSWIDLWKQSCQLHNHVD